MPRACPDKLVSFSSEFHREYGLLIHDGEGGYAEQLGRDCVLPLVRRATPGLASRRTNGFEATAIVREAGVLGYRFVGEAIAPSGEPPRVLLDGRVRLRAQGGHHVRAA